MANTTTCFLFWNTICDEALATNGLSGGVTRMHGTCGSGLLSRRLAVALAATWKSALIGAAPVLVYSAV